jgi:excisionase family DNA binding protein
MAESERLLYRPAEVGELIGVSRARAYELIASKVIPSIRIGSSIRVPADALKVWIGRQLEEQAGR